LLSLADVYMPRSENQQPGYLFPLIVRTKI